MGIRIVGVFLELLLQELVRIANTSSADHGPDDGLPIAGADGLPAGNARLELPRPGAVTQDPVPVGGGHEQAQAGALGLPGDVQRGACQSRLVGPAGGLHEETKDLGAIRVGVVCGRGVLERLPRRFT